MNDILTNGSEIKQRIISEIQKARQNIFLAMAWFTDRDIANAIFAAINRNLNVYIILSSNAQNETVKQMFHYARGLVFNPKSMRANLNIDSYQMGKRSYFSKRLL